MICPIERLISFPGATVDLAALGRAATELDCLQALLPSSTWTLLLGAANASLAVKQSSSECGSPRHYRPSTQEEMQRVFFARLDLINRSAPTIDEGFKVAPPFVSPMTFSPFQDCPEWYPPKYRFIPLNGHLRPDLLELGRNLSEAVGQLITPSTIVVVDESLYEFNGQCPIRRYIPRKPHPNGLLNYCAACYFNVGADQLPVVLDMEPYLLDNQVAPQEALIRLHHRLHLRHAHLRLHVVADSAFGSFDRLAQLNAAGGDATMSMPSQTKPWLWELLDWNCGVDEGRVAFSPASSVVVSSFKVLSETNTLHQIKTISSGCRLETGEAAEEAVVNVTDRRDNADGQREYLTHFADGRTDWLLARDFIDADGTTNLSWLTFADGDDLNRAFESFTANELRVRLLRRIFTHFQDMCTSQGWKPSGDKSRILKRIVKKQKQLSQGKEALVQLLESKIGPKTPNGGPAAQVRRFYTDNYPALDRFDRLWYEMRFRTHPRDWHSHFCWSFLHVAVINARSVWCAIRGERIPLKAFLERLVSRFAETQGKRTPAGPL